MERELTKFGRAWCRLLVILSTFFAILTLGCLILFIVSYVLFHANAGVDGWYTLTLGAAFVLGVKTFVITVGLIIALWVSRYIFRK